jgi:hypothetical protein
MSFWDTLVKIFSAIGGIGFLAGIGVWIFQNLIQFWQDRIKQRNSHVHDKDMALTNNQLERKTHIYLKLAETEFALLQSIWNAVFDYTVAISELIPIFDQTPKELADQVKDYKNRFIKYATAYNVLADLIYKSKPIINEVVFTECEEILFQGRKCGTHFRAYFICNEYSLENSRSSFWSKENETEEYRSNEKELVNERDKLGEQIKRRFIDLSQI